MATTANKKDVRDFKPTLGGGSDAKDTQMLKGEGKFSKDQLEDNVTHPHTTGKAPDGGRKGGESY
jgi:hypothetical protein